jgi:hypothetical protein
MARRAADQRTRKPVRGDRAAALRDLTGTEASLLDLVDNLLNRGVVINAELILAIADVDLVYLRLSALLCAADRVLPAASGPRR